MATVLIGQPLFDGQFGGGEAVGDPRAGLPVAVQEIALRLPALDVGRDRGGNVLPIVTDVDHVLAALTPRLTCADVHGGHAEEGTLANRNTGVPDNSCRTAEKPEKIFRKHVAEQ